jgi:hypothetical protein
LPVTHREGENMKNAKSLLHFLGSARRIRGASMSEDKERVTDQVLLNSLPLPDLIEPGPSWPPSCNPTWNLDHSWRRSRDKNSLDWSRKDAANTDVNPFYY